jgi:glyoxylase-like metal-dependent hydrolase (beta-lactamase superfamily II)/rhodanese-related sulfurtransferase
MEIKQYYLGCLAHASYLIGDDRSGTAAVVDPQRDVDQYLRDASDRGWSIRYVFLTHFHADFLAGHIELRDRAGARIYLGARAVAEYAFTPLKEGDAVTFGDARIEALETPGHTPEAVSLLVFDLAHSADRPRAVLTGDTLFIGDVGRPDLLASAGVSAADLAGMLYDSVTNKLLRLPDDTLVYPAHGAGSLCGKQLSKETVSTIGEQRRYNYALQPMSREEFTRLVASDQPETPGYFAFDVARNRAERPPLDAAMGRGLKPLSLDAFLALRGSGAQVLDVREAADFEGAHLAGSVNVGLRGQYATWCGTVLRHERPILIVAAPGDEPEAVMRLGRIGFDNVAGYLDGGMTALGARPDLVRVTQRVTAPALAERLGLDGAGCPDGGDSRPAVIDVRAPREYAEGHIPGSLNLPLNRLAERLAEIPAGREVVVHCQAGYRSAIAASLLRSLGAAEPADLVGGYKAWTACGLPTTLPPNASAAR